MAPTLRQLTYFLAVADERHVTRAALKLKIQQAPLSQQIRALEEALGLQLFERKPRGMELTASGRAFQQHVRALLTGLDGAVQHARAIERGEIGLLRLGVTTSAWLHPLTTRILRRFGAALPGVSLQIKQAGTPQLTAAMRGGDLDAAIVRGVPAGDGLQIRVLAKEPLWLAAPRARKIADGTTGVALSELVDQDFIGYPRAPGEGIYQDVIAACERRGFTPRFRYEAPQMLSALAMVAAGLGLAIVPNAARAIKLNGLAYQKLRAGEVAAAALSLATPKSKQPDAPVRELQQIAASESSR
jgi:DNA-binding transcriptional LysR family regulator